MQQVSLSNIDDVDIHLVMAPIRNEDNSLLVDASLLETDFYLWLKVVLNFYVGLFDVVHHVLVIFACYFAAKIVHLFIVLLRELAL